ncbi:interleukin-23 receptor isoform X1 [Takifugu rubripes]|uniref:Interleukin-12 receptor subunit beta-2-like n=1 Tax=Takifugu rubripes TaxID=31033 RepID=A0A674NMF4_TAKRU|nr:interleukin-12 receptor subunit beta-2-like isoform X1 [Takifugu rubripes]|eukprot:XP_011613024.1 PREDICTED: interleukin-12 receptor subunit beta-2-like isoform X1 [Takifugu rubripes]
MNLLFSGWRCSILLLILSILQCPLLLIGCFKLNCCGYLTVEPAPLVLLGSNLTIYCHRENCSHWKNIYMVVNEKQCTVEKINSTTVSYSLVNIQTALTTVICRTWNPSGKTLVCGLDLKAGLPPDKPQNVRCETWRSAPFLECTWERGRETHLNTIYNISVSRENGTQIILTHVNGSAKVPRSAIDEDGKYQVNVMAHNHFGSSQSDPVYLCLEDMVIPEAPRIVQITFESTTLAALLQWNTTESSRYLKSYIRLRTGNGSWEAREATEIREGLVRVLGLAPLTEYTFQMRTCHLRRTLNPSCTNSTANSQKSFCSRWSLSAEARSPGKGPSQQLQVWRILRNLGADKGQNVTVMWKPPPPEDFSGEVQFYKISAENMEERNYSAVLRQCTFQVPAGLQAVSVSAATLYGTSPPANVSLRRSGVSGTLLREVLPADNGSALLVSWLWLREETGGELLHFVLEWAGLAVTEPQWKRLANDQNNTSITGLSAGVRYKVSLYAVTSAGVSEPSSKQVYSREQKPVSGPSLSVLRREPERILVQWDSLPVDQQRGFITAYSIYLQTLDFSSTEYKVTVNGSGPGQKWLDCPEGTLVLQATASTSAGEGLRGIQIYHPAVLPADLSPLIVTALIVVVFVAMIINLMCIGCVKERIKKKCLSWRPACLDEPLPRPGNSVAIRLLKLDGNEPTLSSPFLDPPLSPISLISQEDIYPSVPADGPKAGSGPLPAESPLLTQDPETAAHTSVLGHDVSYKPQLALVAPQESEVESEEEQWGMPASLEDGREGCWEGPGGLVGDLFPSAVADSPSVTLCFVGGTLLLQAPQRNLLQPEFSVGQRASEDEEDVKSSALELPQCEIMDYTARDPDLPPNKPGTAMYDGYFPQVAPACSSVCESTMDSPYNLKC